MVVRAVGVALALGVAVAPASAVSFQKGIVFNAATIKYNPASDGTPPTSISAIAIPYEAFAFSIDVTGSYQLGNTASGGYKPYLTLYAGGWDAAAPLTNALQAIHYTAQSQFAASFTRTLTVGTTYIAVLAGEPFAASPNGNYSGIFSINGPGTVTQAAAVPGIPEPASWAMMVGGFAAIGGALRRRRPAGADAVAG